MQRMMNKVLRVDGRSVKDQWTKCEASNTKYQVPGASCYAPISYVKYTYVQFVN